MNEEVICLRRLGQKQNLECESKQKSMGIEKYFKEFLIFHRFQIELGIFT